MSGAGGAQACATHGRAERAHAREWWRNLQAKRTRTRAAPDVREGQRAAQRRSARASALRHSTAGTREEAQGKSPGVSTAAPLPEGAERAGTGAVANVPFAGSTAH